MRIGRGTDTTLPLSDPRASRAHAAITYTGDRFILTDLGSTNGTRVNGDTLTGGHVLRDGDHIGIGDTTITFHTTDN